MLNSQERMKVIIDRLILLKETVAANGRLGLTDIHKSSENFIMEILNIVYNYNLENLNEKPNYPGLDLADFKLKIAVQVSSNNTSGKLNRTLETCIKFKHYTKFSQIKFVVLGNKQRKYSINYYPELSFDLDEDVLDIDDILASIMQLQTDKQKLVYDFIVKETYEKIPKNLTSIPYTNSFVGRKKDLIRVKNILSRNNNIVIVGGIGGIGKTTFVKKLVSQLRNIHHIQHIAWLTVSSDLKLEFSSHKELINSLQINKFKDSDFDQIQSIDDSFSTLLSRLRVLNHVDYNLLVLDNAFRIDGHTLHLIGNLQNDGWKIIITSREKIDGFEEYQLDVLNAKDAQALFYMHYKIEINDELSSKISKMLGYHSLLIEIIALTSQFYEWNLDEVLDRLQNLGFNIVQRTNIQISHNEHFTIENIENYINKIFSLSKLKPSVQNMLRKICVLPYQNYKLNEVKDFLNISTSDENFTILFKELVLKGWIQSKQTDEGKAFYNMHPVVAVVAQKKLSPNLKSASSLVDSLIKKLNIDYEKGENPISKSRFIIYAVTVWPFLKETNSQQDILISDLARKMCIYYWAVGEQDKALLYGEISLRIKKLYVSQDHQDLGDMYNNLSLIYLEKNQHEEALKYALMDKDLLERTLESDDKTVAISYSNLCNVYHKKGWLLEAVYYGEKAINIQENDIRNDLRADLAISYKNMALVYQSLYHHNNNKSYLEKGLNYAEAAYSIRKEILKKHHPYMASIYYTLATIKNDFGQYTEAKSDIIECIEITKKNFPNGHKSLSQAEDLYFNIETNLSE